MSKYTFKLNNHHAVKEAEIELNGITVLSGVNGCGKSTISRWLHYAVGGIVFYEDFALREFCEKLVNILYEYYELRLPSKDVVLDITYRDAISQINSLRYKDNADEKALLIFNQAVEYYAKKLESFLLENNSSALLKDRIIRHLSLDASDIQQSLNEYIKKQFARATKARSVYIDKINNRDKSFFDEFVSRYFRIQEDYPNSFSLIEDDDNLISSRIGWLYGIKDSIYIETPIEVASEDSGNFLWEDFSSQLTSNKNHQLSFEERKIALRIQQEMSGDVYLQQRVVDWELRYKSLDGNLDVPVKQLATGFKTMSYILRLIENGELTDKTLLIIDEPEAHLHPQWIVEYARILILIHTKLGVKIFLNSHNPDFVSAIQSIAQKENVIQDVSFYIAKKESESDMYIYENLGQDISEIFKSFNVALERIEFYGTDQN